MKCMALMKFGTFILTFTSAFFLAQKHPINLIFNDQKEVFILFIFPKAWAA